MLYEKFLLFQALEISCKYVVLIKHYKEKAMFKEAIFFLQLANACNYSMNIILNILEEKL